MKIDGTETIAPLTSVENAIGIAKRKVAKSHRKVARQRKDFLHKQSHRMVRDHNLIAVEELQVKNMVKNRKLAKSISDAVWQRFITFLTYKAERQGKRLVKVPS